MVVVNKNFILVFSFSLFSVVCFAPETTGQDVPIEAPKNKLNKLNKPKMITPKQFELMDAKRRAEAAERKAKQEAYNVLSDQEKALLDQQQAESERQKKEAEDAQKFDAEKKKALRDQTAAQAKNMQMLFDHIKVFHPEFTKLGQGDQVNIMSDFVKENEKRQMIKSKIENNPELMKAMDSFDSLYADYDTNNLEDVVANHNKLKDLRTQKDKLSAQLFDKQEELQKKIKTEILNRLGKEDQADFEQELEDQLKNEDNVAVASENSLLSMINKLIKTLNELWEKIELLKSSSLVTTSQVDREKIEQELSLLETEYKPQEEKYNKLMEIYRLCFGDEDNIGILQSMVDQHDQDAQSIGNQINAIEQKVSDVNNENEQIKKQESAYRKLVGQRLFDSNSTYKGMYDNPRYNQDELFKKVKADIRKEKGL